MKTLITHAFMRLLILFGIFSCNVNSESTDTTIPITTSTRDTITEKVKMDYFNSFSSDWGAEDVRYEYYEIPVEYSKCDGYFPEKVQIYTQAVSKRYGVDYALVLAVIEVESGYKYECIGDNDNSKGYMQIYEKFHIDRMKKLGCTDLLNPYQNIVVGIDYLHELLSENSDIRYALMCYNRGRYNDSGTGGVELWEKGIYSTEYSNTVMEVYERIQNTLVARV